MTERPYHGMAGKSLAASLALASMITLSGCSLTSIYAPLSETSATVSEARAAQAAKHPAKLTSSDLVKEGVLTVGLQTESVSGPFFISGEAGKIYGIDVDFASAIADNLGLRVSFVKVDDVDPSLAKGLCDVVLDADASHLSSSVMVGSYYESAVALFAKGEVHTATVSELTGKKVGVQEGSVSQGDLNHTSLDLKQTAYENLNECFDALDKGDVDLVLCDAYSGAYLATAHPGVAFVGTLGEPVSMGAAVAADKSNLLLAMQSATTTILNDGYMEIIRSRWVKGLPSLNDGYVIENVPLQMSTPTLGDTNEPGDGSTAGANAVILS